MKVQHHSIKKEYYFDGLLKDKKTIYYPTQDRVNEEISELRTFVRENKELRIVDENKIGENFTRITIESIYSNVTYIIIARTKEHDFNIPLIL
jgi:hypothetical protein